MTKNVTIRDDVYHKLVQMKRGRSFSQLLDDLVEEYMIPQINIPDSRNAAPAFRQNKDILKLFFVADTKNKEKKK